VIGCKATPEAIAHKLTELFPRINKGRKKAADIVAELALGECSVQEYQGQIIRVVNLVSIFVVDGDRYLIEAYQELASGEKFPRTQDGLPIKGVSEKMQFPETPEEGAYRGLEEELGVFPRTLEFLSESFEKNQSSKYEGIESYAKKYQFRATLNPEDIKEHGWYCGNQLMSVSRIYFGSEHWEPRADYWGTLWQPLSLVT
jgi:hypothetical protein